MNKNINPFVEESEIEDIEIQLLLEAIYMKYGYDFRQYSRAHIKRRINYRMEKDGIKTVSDIQGRILRDISFFEYFLRDFSINVTEMFRDPGFYKVIREEIVPVLKTYPFIKIWHAGCASGEEVYSMAILLKEEGLLNKTQLYATDFNVEILKEAKKGIYPIENIKTYTYNYQKAGGTESFSNYYVADNNYVIMDQSLKEKIVFSEHNLVFDGVFGEMNMVICRNVLIYFEKTLQNRVLNLFKDSLTPGGFLGLGTKETLSFSDIEDKFQKYNEEFKIYRLKII